MIKANYILTEYYPKKDLVIKRGISYAEYQKTLEVLDGVNVHRYKITRSKNGKYYITVTYD